VILYLTHNDPPTGVYWSQVTDVVRHMDALGGGRMRLLALVSGRGYLRTRRAIRRRLPGAHVVPMVPRASNWRMNTLLVEAACRAARPSGIMARGVFATWMALRMRQRGLVRRVVFDARGAYAAEWTEYRLVDDDRLIAQVAELERKAVLESDARLAVSEALVRHWREAYQYEGRDHVVVPCTLGDDVLADAEPDDLLRPSLGWSEDDLVLVYSGSTAGWQSFALLEALLEPLLAADPRVRTLFLSRNDPHVQRLAQRHPGRVAQRWVDHGRVRSVLAACDAGLLVREDTVTNRVASPTKFGEYLSAGLPVIISEGLGDFSALVEEEDLGWVSRAGTSPPVRKLDALDRARLRNFALRHFTKAAYNHAYLRLKAALAGPQ
jgi:hypothetical protein